MGVIIGVRAGRSSAVLEPSPGGGSQDSEQTPCKWFQLRLQHKQHGANDQTRTKAGGVKMSTNGC